MEVLPALVAFLAAVIVSIISTFLGENYRRRQDAAALAAALAGELGAAAERISETRSMLDDIIVVLRNDHKISRRDPERRNNPIFESNVAKIGILGTELAGEVAYVYSGLDAFRTTLHLVNKYGHEMDKSESLPKVTYCLDLLNKNEARFRKLISDLDARSKVRWFAKVSP